jgi:hypothetical protein
MKTIRLCFDKLSNQAKKSSKLFAGGGLKMSPGTHRYYSGGYSIPRTRLPAE